MQMLERIALELSEKKEFEQKQILKNIAQEVRNAKFNESDFNLIFKGNENAMDR